MSKMLIDIADFVNVKIQKVSSTAYCLFSITFFPLIFPLRHVLTTCKRLLIFYVLNKKEKFNKFDF